MQRRIVSQLRRCTAVTVSIIAASATAHAQAAPAQRPNILLVIMDDVGLDVTTGMYPGLIDGLEKQYGASGRKHPKATAIKGRPASTPNLDKFARQGMVFTNAWAQPFCSPTRASILTGLFAFKANVLTYEDPLSQNYTSFVQKLKDDGGYSTALFGKWHLAGMPNKNYPGMKPKEAGFDLFRGNMYAAIKTFWDYDYFIQDDKTSRTQWRSEAPPMKSLPGIAPSTYAPLVQVADTLDWIGSQEKANPAKPWFAWLAFNLSHATSSRQPSQMPVPNKDTLDAKSLDEMTTCGGKFGTMDTGKCSGEAVMRADTNSLDTLLGKLVDQIDKLDPNTYVIVLGDNGTPMYGRANLDFIDNMYITIKGRGKGTAFESGARVAMAIRGPKIPAASRSNEPVHVADLFSTTLSLAGLKAPERVSTADGVGTQPLDSVSLTPILLNKAKRVRDPNKGFVLTESVDLMNQGKKQVGARNATYKVMCEANASIESCLFYNLVNDPLEEYPLAKPANCTDYQNGKWKPTAPEWSFCRLQEAVAKESFMAANK
jgi:arylsulfatase A-like enzyme